MNKGYALFAAVVLCACGSNSFKPVYTPAAKGTTTGTATMQMIDNTGGKVVSSDGRLELTIPSGMFTTATQVGIQPITDTAPNGQGLAYRLTPEGTTFSQPVTVTFHLDAMQMVGLDSTFIASQHSDGLWYSQPHQSRDSSAHTVSVPAKHFSDWAVAQTLMLKPQETRVKVSQQASFVPQILAVKDDGDELANPAGDEEIAIPEPTQLNSTNNATIQSKPTWQVNSIEGGNSQVGQVSDNAMTGNYKAPTAPPNPSEVTVSATVQLGKSKVVAPAKATIYAQETWAGNSHITLADGTVVDSTFTFAQTSDDGHGKLTFNVQSGNVHAVVPATLPSGCSQTATPTDYAIGTNDGQMTATYDLGSGGESPMITGMGDTVWLANYTTMCPNGTGSMMLALQAEWWPFQLGGMPVPVQANNGVFDDVVQTASASGQVHLVRQ